MKKYYFLLLPCLILLSCGFSGKKPVNDKNPEITRTEIQASIDYLASDELKGRFTGTEGAKLAADYIRDEFSSYGLKPFFNGSYFQEFPFVAGIEATDKNSLKLTAGQSEKSLKLNEDFIPAPFSDNLSVSGSLVFAGYGISAPELNYDDYKDLDVKDKVVILLRHSPDSDNPHSKFEKYSELRSKLNTAKEKGAKGVIFVNGYLPKDDEDKFISSRYDGAPQAKGVDAVHVKRKFIEEIFRHSGLDFKEHQEKMNKSLKPSSFAVKSSGALVTTEIKKLERQGQNVAGFIEGSDPKLKDEFIVIGAHYDHLGMGETGSLYRGKDTQIHNGADDNASGTTGVLELAEKIASVKSQIKRSVIFVAFSGEELGLLGSNYFVNNLSVPSGRIITMINMDMIGRMNDENSLTVYGAGTSKLWKDVLNKINDEKYKFKLSFNDEGFGPSDHSSFYAKEIPVLFFFTGIHTDYHRPSDDADKINSDKEEQILRYVYDIYSQVDSGDDKPDYVNVPRKDTGGAMRFKVYVGTIPDYSSQAEGFKITGVSEGSPAQKAGLKGGDVIVEFGGKKVANIYDYMYAMNEFAPGDVVEVVIVRDKDKVNLKIELAAR